MSMAALAMTESMRALPALLQNYLVTMETMI